MFILQLSVSGVLPRHLALGPNQANPVSYTKPNSTLPKKDAIKVARAIARGKDDDAPNQVLVKGTAKSGWQPVESLFDLVSRGEVKVRRSDLKSSDNDKPFIIFDFWGKA